MSEQPKPMASSPSPRERRYRERMEALASKILLDLIKGGTSSHYLASAAEKSVEIAARVLAAVDAAEVPE